MGKKKRAIEKKEKTASRNQKSERSSIKK